MRRLLGIGGSTAEISPESGEPLAEIDRVLLAAPCDQTNRQFVAGWLGWRGKGLLPRRDEIDLDDMKTLRGGMMMFELGGPEEIRVATAGSRMCAHTGCDVTGKRFSEISPLDGWPMRRWRMLEAARRPCGTIVIAHDLQTEGDGVRFEVVTLPLDPEAPGAARWLVSHIAVLGGIYEPPSKHRTAAVPPTESFRFLDLGAGVPEKPDL
jgi:hypothetical protein